MVGMLADVAGWAVLTRFVGISHSAQPTLTLTPATHPNCLTCRSSALFLALCSSGGAVTTDPLLTWMHSQAGIQCSREFLPSDPGGGTPTGSSASGNEARAQPASLVSSGGRSGGSQPLADIHPWQIRFEELRFIRPIGEGSFGKVRKQLETMRKENRRVNRLRFGHVHAYWYGCLRQAGLLACLLTCALTLVLP